MTILLYNTLTRAKEDFVPLKPDAIGLYVCGPTVYDFAHIGNARPVVVFDVLYRLLKQVFPGHRVTYVRNITDVDDKIIAASQKSGEPMATITARTTEAFHEDMGALGALPPDVEPRATAHIAQMTALVETLIAKGHAYPTGDGHVLFHVPSMADYGQLSRLDRREVIEGARVEVADYKKDAADFVLWKPSGPEQPGWESPWGRGRPGWHIECSAMSGQYLGKTFDIHGGGQDLIFPHHENEIAQSRCAHGTPIMASVWMHNGYLMVEGEKMSKSLGNFFTVRELLAKHPGEAIRLALLSTHYRQPLDFTDRKLVQAKAELNRFYTALRIARQQVAIQQFGPPEEIVNELRDDLDTPMAVARLHDIVSDLNNAMAPHTKTDTVKIAELAGKLVAGGYLLGLLQQDPEAWFKGRPAAVGGLEDAAIDALIAERTAARKARDFARADRIRDELKGQDILLEDGPGGTTWRRA